MGNQYYTLEEVMQKLEKSRSTVLREAKAGLIPSEVKEGRLKGRRYPKAAIDALAEIKQAKEKGKKAPKFIYSPSTPNDLWAEVKIGAQLYGEDDIVPFKKLLEWREINDEMFMSLKENGKVIAYSSLMLLEEEVILSLIEDKIRERDIPNSAIKQWTDPQLSVYIASVTANPTGDKEVDTRRGWMVIRHTLKWALSLDRQFSIVNWYGVGATKEGQALFEDLGFSEIASLYNGERKGYKIRDIKQPTQLITKFTHTMNLPDVDTETH
jgi:predicted DNA-binding transcriptional regulator AlpA